MAIFAFSKMAAVRHIGFLMRVFGPPTKVIYVVFITVQNLVGIDAVVIVRLGWEGMGISKAISGHLYTVRLCLCGRVNRGSGDTQRAVLPVLH